MAGVAHNKRFSSHPLHSEFPWFVTQILEFTNHVDNAPSFHPDIAKFAITPLNSFPQHGLISIEAVFFDFIGVKFLGIIPKFDDTLPLGLLL